ncbi:glycosyltransferase family 2 protein [Metaplanococcus flavidus]|uniref:Glycosyltransferase family 2 protein n=1 Tax=Metaplanococcus flavidus TaxID=569883 RepID=A0ABW3L9M2_9BACL
MESRVSVIIPTFNGAKNLSRAIDSVLEQTYKSVEVIVVDDNEPGTSERDQTEEVMKNYNKFRSVKYIKHSMNKISAAARNTGIAASLGSYICFLNDDDFYHRSRIAKCLALLKANPQYEGIYCGVVIIDKSSYNSIVRPVWPLTQRELLLDGNTLGTGSNFFLSRKAVEFVGGFDDRFIRHQDIEFMIRILEDFKVLNFEEIMIGKVKDGVNNPSNYSEFRELKKFYMLKFENTIDRLDPPERKLFYIYQYEDLFHEAIKSGQKEYIFQSLQELSLFREITSKDRLRILISEKRLYKKRIYIILRLVYDKSKNRRVSYHLEKQIDPSAKSYVFNFLCGIGTATEHKTRFSADGTRNGGA